MCVYLLGFYKSVQDMGWYFRMNLHLPIHILWHYQTAMSARKRLNANISCHPTEANGLSNKLLYLESMAWWHSRFSLSIVFSIADESEKVRFELPSLPVMLEKKWPPCEYPLHQSTLLVFLASCLLSEWTTYEFLPPVTSVLIQHLHLSWFWYVYFSHLDWFYLSYFIHTCNIIVIMRTKLSFTIM